MKIFIIRNMPSQSVQTTIHATKVQRMTLFNVRQIHTGEYEAISCDGRNFNGCKTAKEGDKDVRRTDEAEKLFHCDKCGYDMCKPCMSSYGEIHRHPMEEMTYAELKERDGNYSSGWGCDCRHFKSCRTDPYEGFQSEDQYSVVYHDADAFFDLCEKCADFY